MIISALTSFMYDQQPGLAKSVNCYPTISFKDDEGTVKTDIMNRYFLMFQDDTPKGRTKENIL
jgi:microsomal prostaglandin-E synthase 2